MLAGFLVMTHFRDVKKKNLVSLKKFSQEVTRRRKKKKQKTGFRVELRAKSNFKSNVRGKLRQTIYFFWPNANLINF